MAQLWPSQCKKPMLYRTHTGSQRLHAQNGHLCEWDKWPCAWHDLLACKALFLSLTPTPKINASRLYSNGKWLIAHFLSSHCHAMCITPWNTLVWWVTCKFIGFPDFVIHVHHCHQLCIFFKVRIPLLHKFCTLKSFIVQFFLLLCSRACSNVLLYIFLHIVVAMCS